METVLDEPEYRMHQTSRNCSFRNETNAVETEDVQSREVIPPTIKGQLISKCPFGVKTSSKKPKNFFPGFLP